MIESAKTPDSMRRSASAGAAVAALALALTGCGGADDPETGAPVSTQSTTAEASPTPSLSEGSGTAAQSPNTSPEESEGEFVPASSDGPAQNVPVPEMPEAAKEQTQEGLEAALEYWWETEAHLKAAGNKSLMEEVSSNDCSLCTGLMDRWTEIYELGGWAKSEPADVIVQFASLDNEGQGGTGSLLVSESASQIYQPDGSIGGSGDGSDKRPWVFSASFDKDAKVWTVDGLQPQG